MKHRQAPKQLNLKENIFMKDSKGNKVAIYRYLDKDEAYNGIDKLRKRELQFKAMIKANKNKRLLDSDAITAGL